MLPLWAISGLLSCRKTPLLTAAVLAKSFISPLSGNLIVANRINIIGNQRQYRGVLILARGGALPRPGFLRGAWTLSADGSGVKF